MLENFFQLIKIGEELGLSKKEIKKVFLFEDSRYPLFFRILVIILAMLGGFFVIIFVFKFSEYIYPAGALYSTVKIKDFDKKE
ncbi:hypothetical protein ES705_27094 [subsurface metagenome]